MKLNTLRISSLEYDSRRVAPGCAFFALPGVKTDGNRFVAEALARGAVDQAFALDVAALASPDDADHGYDDIEQMGVYDGDGDGGHQ